MKLTFDNLSKDYGTKSALSHLTMELEPGIYGLLGPNGAGKSTLLNILVGNLAPSEGKILCDGKDIRKMGKDYRRLIGYMPQQQNLYPTFTGREFLIYMAVLKEVPKKEIAERVETMAKQVNLQDELGKRLGAYSGGMKQRILLAAAMIHDPAILVLDEPTAGLDPKERIRIRNLIAASAVDKIVIIATHVVSDVEIISKEIIVMKEGQLLRKKPIVDLTREVAPFVYEGEVPVSQMKKLEEKYAVTSIFSDGSTVRMRFLSDTEPKGNFIRPDLPTLEDVYLYHFYQKER